MARDPHFPKAFPEFPRMSAQLKKATNRPRIGVTQGGSSRKDAGAKVAATRAKARKGFKPEKFK